MLKNIICRDGQFSNENGHFINYVYDDIKGWFMINGNKVSSISSVKDIHEMFGIFGRMGHIFLYSRIDEDVITCRPLYWNFRTYSALLPENAINDFKNSFKSRRTRAATNFFGRSNALKTNAPMIKESVNVRKRTSPNRKKQQTLTQQYCSNGFSNRLHSNSCWS